MSLENKLAAGQLRGMARQALLACNADLFLFKRLSLLVPCQADGKPVLFAVLRSGYLQIGKAAWFHRHRAVFVLQLDLALFGAFDYGRVWLKEESSNSWKTSYGGGLSLGAVDMINLNAGLFGSPDGTYFRFGLGFEF